MTRRKLGVSSGLEVFPFALGGNVFGWTADEAMSFRLLDAFVDAGFNLIDTADTYSRWVPGNRGGESEVLLGKWLKRSGKRHRVIVATKGGSEMGPGRKGLSARYLRAAIDESLERLQTDYVDLYQSHRDDPDTQQEETLGTYDALIRGGKVRAIGASNFPPERLRSALELSRKQGYASYQSLQPKYNLYDRADYETNLEALCLEEGLGVITYYSLASGFLTGKYRSADDAARSPRGEGASRMLDARGRRILEALDTVALEHAVAPATIALAWLMHRPSVTAPIASATNLEQMGELIAAADLSLQPGEMHLLDAASAY